MDYLKAYREMAAGGKQFRGLSLLSNAKRIGDFIRELNAGTVLDYGSGAGDAYRDPHKVHHTWGLKWQNVTCYDPSFKQYAKKPDRRFDVVICSDVLEHIPEQDVDRFIADLFDHAKLGVWASVCTRPAKKFFSDGTNLHCTIKPVEWWRSKFEAKGLRWELVETE